MNPACVFVDLDMPSGRSDLQLCSVRPGRADLELNVDGVLDVVLKLTQDDLLALGTAMVQLAGRMHLDGL